MSFSTTENTITTLQAAGATCKIHSHGATVISFQSANNKRENLFVSSIAKLDGSKAIRGGIPIVFPIFGPPASKESTMPQHGFCRVNPWKLTGTTEEEKAATATYELLFEDAVKGRGENNIWSKEEAEKNGLDCKLAYQVRLEAQCLTCTLTMSNTGKCAFPAQALLHTYFTIQAPQDTEKTFVEGLDNYTIVDKITKEQGHANKESKIVIVGEVDREYHPPAKNDCLTTNITDSGSKLTIQATAKDNNSNDIPVSCVVWNPGKDKAGATSDLDDNAYEHMMCVEPGILKPVTLEPGQSATFSQTITVNV